MRKLTPQEARVICDALDLDELLGNDEEIALLREHNPELWEAYQSLYLLAYPMDDSQCKDRVLALLNEYWSKLIAAQAKDTPCKK